MLYKKKKKDGEEKTNERWKILLGGSCYPKSHFKSLIASRDYLAIF